MADRDGCILLWRIIGMTLGLLMNFVTSITPYWAVNIGPDQLQGQIMNFGIFYTCKKEIPWCFMSYKELNKIPIDETNRWERLNFPNWLITCQFFAALGLALSFVGVIAGCCQSVTDNLGAYGKKGRLGVAMIFFAIAFFNLIVGGIWFTTIKIEFLDVVLDRWKQHSGAKYIVGWTAYLASFTILINIVTGILFVTKTEEDEDDDDDEERKY